ncbi:MAG: alanine dehydrogenase [Coxiellaceae bacterium]|nr:alanine dehydrogenase [Coxiellaceae bacterium]
MYKVFLSKESRAGEQRVALVPQHVKQLVTSGNQVVVEQGAGVGAGYSDQDYQLAGASLVHIEQDSVASFKDAFKDIDIIIRAKRPNAARESLELKAVSAGTTMVGALDPLESHSDHIAQYHAAGLKAYSIDQLALPADDPMNILAAMSRLAGQLSLKDAMQKCQLAVKTVVIIGFGEAGRSAFHEAKQQGLQANVIVGNQLSADRVRAAGGNAVIVDRTLPLKQQQLQISAVASTAEIVITTARKSGQKAPLLIPESTLANMQSGAVVVDLAISEGGNVEGSQHDKTIEHARGVLITNVSGYPKVVPGQASELWSQASLAFIQQLAKKSTVVESSLC